MVRKKQSPEALLRSGMVIDVPVTGWSMYPLFSSGRDRAILTPFAEIVSDGAERKAEFPSINELKRGDVALFRRSTGKLVLHRIYHVQKDGYWFVGDNLPQIERGIKKEQLLGLMTGFIRNGKKVNVRNIRYRILSGIWLCLRPFRPLMHKLRGHA